MIDEYHYIQRKILNQLLFTTRLRYSELKPLDMEGSQFTFHLNKLINLALVTKDADQYTLTSKGKEVANSFDIDSNTPTRQAKHSVVFCALREYKDHQQALIYTRKKNPFYDHQGFPTGKVRYGDNILDTAERELKEETGLIGNAELIGIRHYRVYYPSNETLVEDKVMYIHRVINPTGDIVSNNEGEFYWVNLEDIESIVTNPLPEFHEILQMIKNFNGAVTFKEINHYPNQY